MSGCGQGVLVTGGAKRIGKAIACAFAEAGWRVAVHCNRSRAEAKALVQALPGKGHCVVQGDLREEKTCKTLIAKVVEGGFPLRCLVNSAAVYVRGRPETMEMQKAKDVYQVNFFAPFELMRQFHDVVGKGAIVNLLDQKVATTDPDAAVYQFSKKSLRDATETCALAWAPAIRVNSVAPGIVLPPPGGSFEKMCPLLRKIPMRDRVTEEEIAAAVLWLAQGNATGNILYLDGGLHLTAGVESPV